METLQKAAAETATVRQKEKLVLVQEVRRVVAVVEKYYFLATAGGCFGRRLKVHIVVVVVVVGAGVEENRCDTPNVILR